jgi:predicted unusual protein kinase regulating ubiquinone biosynthesis (AarF/ABC1/UbiB family)
MTETTKDEGQPGEINQIARGFGGRTWKTMRLAGRLGVGYAKRTLVNGKSELTQKQRDQAIKRAEELVSELGALKGLVMKVGQIASYMPGAMPPEAQRVLAKLQAKTTSLPFVQVAAIVQDELGKPPHEAFDSFDETPFAAASIGQVHRAVLDGRDVAVKVQYPGIRDVIASDLKTVGLFAKLSAMGNAMDGGVVAQELTERLLEECDYHLEAENQRYFRQLWASYDQRHVPEVIASHSSGRVLCTELVDKLHFHRFCDEATQEAKDRAGVAIFHACFQSIFEHAVYNADPHPGNYLFPPDGAPITFLDFGCVRRFSPDMVATWKRTARTALAGDRPGWRQATIDLGFVGNERKFDWEHQWAITEHLYRPYLSQEPFTFTHDYVRQGYGLMIFNNPNMKHTSMPAEWVFLNRLQWGVYSILAYLNATGPWGDMWREAIA